MMQIMFLSSLNGEPRAHDVYGDRGVTATTVMTASKERTSVKFEEWPDFKNRQDKEKVEKEWIMARENVEKVKP